MRKLLGAWAQAVCCVLLLAACGGGGGGGENRPSGSVAPVNTPPPSVGYTLSETKITREFSVLDTGPVSAEISVMFTNATTPPFGFGGKFSFNAVTGVFYESTGALSGKVTIWFWPPYERAPNTYLDSVTFGACVDEACDATTPETTSAISTTYTVKPATLPTVAMSTSVVNVTGPAGDTTPVPKVEITGTVSAPAPFAGYSTSTTHNGVASILYNGVTNSQVSFTLTMMRPSSLQKGTYTDTIDVRMCLDQACLNPLVVTPSTITVNYTLSDTVDGPNGYTAKLTSAHAHDLAWDGIHNTMYMAVPADSPDHASTVTAYDPVSDTFGGSVSAGADPWILALSNDATKLYAAGKRENQIRRFSTAPLAPDITIALGDDASSPGDPLIGTDLKVVPNNARAVVVRRSNPNASGTRGLVLFDDAIARPNVAFASPNLYAGFSEWGDDSRHLFTNTYEVAVDANGLTEQSNYPGLSGGRFGRVGDRIFGEWGQVTDVVARAALPKISLLGSPYVMTVDPTLARIYYLTRSGDNAKTQIEAYDANSFALIGTGRLPQYAIDNITPIRVMRWGRDGLAIVTESNNVILVTGPLIAP
jgi:hypothetical protein